MADHQDIDQVRESAVEQAYASTGELPSPETVARLVATAHTTFKKSYDGVVADYIPALAAVPPDLFGISVAGTNGNITSAGDTDHLFTIQSVSKPFVFALVCQELGPDSARSLLGVNATGQPFNSVMAVELNESRTMNPMVNAGAIATTSLVPGESADEKWRFLVDGLSRFAGRDLKLNNTVLASERAANHRNQGMALLLENYGRMYCDPLLATDVYTRQCSLEVTAKDLAIMGATLANGGVNPVTGIKVVDWQTSKRVIAVMATAGLYETSGDWLYDTGLPGKSGVGGGMVTLSPGKGALATFAPRLDASGNSVKGQLTARFLSDALGLNLFASKPAQTPSAY